MTTLFLEKPIAPHFEGR